MAEALHLHVTGVLERALPDCRLPASFFPYMAHMLLEEPPRTPADLEALLGPFIENAEGATPALVQARAGELFARVRECVGPPETAWVAERLEAPVVMERVQLITEEEVEKGYTDTPFAFETLKFGNEVIDPEQQLESQKLERQREKERRKQLEEMRRRAAELEQVMTRLPPVQVRRVADAGYSRDILVDSFDLEVSGRRLLDGAKLTLAAGRRYGLIGRNGIGKTTLLYALVRKELPGMNTHPQILMVEQEVAGSPKSPLALVMETDAELTALLAQREALLGDDSGARALAELAERLEAIDAHRAEPRARALLAGLGFSAAMVDGPSALLSGGWRMRVALAKILFCRPDVLLLDEPTNHLDLDAVLWLEDYLQRFDSTVLVVSHAREFLDAVCTDIVHLDQQKLRYYKGGFFEFERQRDADTQRQQREFDAQQRHISHVKEFVDRFRYNAKRAAMVQSRIKYLGRLERVEAAVRDDPDVAFDFGAPEAVRSPLARIDEGAFGYAGAQALLEDLNFALDSDSKIALLGANGVGKTTLLKLLTGALELSAGQLALNRKARVAMFSQHHVERLDVRLTPLEQLAALFPAAAADAHRKHLARFGLNGAAVLRPIYTLSGGQKSRISLALAAWDQPHLLIMDEPTNHLDMEAVDALILALSRFPGALLIVSHDQYFVSCVCEEIWYIRQRRLKRFKGDFEAYRTALATNGL